MIINYVLSNYKIANTNKTAVLQNEDGGNALLSDLSL